MDSGFISFIKNNKRVWRVGILVLLGIVLILISSAFGTESEKESNGLTLEEYKEKLEGELAELCSDVKGVGRCKVFVTFERGELNTYKSGAIIEKRPPKVLGVTVICQGADSDSVKGELTGMITALFDVGANRVAVLKLN